MQKLSDSISGLSLRAFIALNPAVPVLSLDHELLMISSSGVSRLKGKHIHLLHHAMQSHLDGTRTVEALLSGVSPDRRGAVTRYLQGLVEARAAEQFGASAACVDTPACRIHRSDKLTLLQTLYVLQSYKSEEHHIVVITDGTETVETRESELRMVEHWLSSRACFHNKRLSIFCVDINRHEVTEYAKPIRPGGGESLAKRLHVAEISEEDQFPLTVLRTNSTLFHPKYLAASDRPLTAERSVVHRVFAEAVSKVGRVLQPLSTLQVSAGGDFVVSPIQAISTKSPFTVARHILEAYCSLLEGSANVEEMGEDTLCDMDELMSKASSQIRYLLGAISLRGCDGQLWYTRRHSGLHTFYWNAARGDSLLKEKALRDCLVQMLWSQYYSTSEAGPASDTLLPTSDYLNFVSPHDLKRLVMRQHSRVGDGGPEAIVFCRAHAWGTPLWLAQHAEHVL